MRRLAYLVISSVILLSSVQAHALSFTTEAYVELTVSGIQADITNEVGTTDNMVDTDQGSYWSNAGPAVYIPGGGAADSGISDTNAFTSAPFLEMALPRHW